AGSRRNGPNLYWRLGFCCMAPPLKAALINFKPQFKDYSLRFRDHMHHRRKTFRLDNRIRVGRQIYHERRRAAKGLWRWEMKKNSKTEITIETQRTLLIRRQVNPVAGWCADCSANSDFVSPEEAARLTAEPVRAIYQGVERDRFHFVETEDRHLRICVRSLPGTGDQSAEAETAAPAPLSAPVSEMIMEVVKPDGSKSRRKSWTLTKDALNLLLEALDIDRERAGSKYEMIRAKLMKFFECRGCVSPEDLADETINRVARRLYEGRQIWAAEPASYFYGVARNVLREYWVSIDREFEPLEQLTPGSHPREDYRRQREAEAEKLEAEEHLEQLAACLDQLSPESRELILEYYEGEQAERIRRRKELAER